MFKASLEYPIHISGFLRPAVFVLENTCTPYSKQACLDEIYHLGLKKGGNGHKFEDAYGNKGCYAYVRGQSNFSDMVFYGTGGTEDDMSKTLTANDLIYRPPGYDCSPSKGALKSFL